MDSAIALPYPSLDPRRLRAAFIALVAMTLVAGMVQGGSWVARSGAAWCAHAS